MTKIVYRDIPFLDRYQISASGVVWNKYTKKRLAIKMNGKNPSVQVKTNNGDRTTRGIKQLLELVWGKK